MTQSPTSDPRPHELTRHGFPVFYILVHRRYGSPSLGLWLAVAG
jgi:hypothetical protein